MPIENNEKNPFSKECTECIKNFWETTQNKSKKSEQKISSQTYIWLEKIKENN